MRVKIKALTLIWTGDVDGKCSGIKETGVIGSLRWWYEALVRGLGGYACDPTSKGKCELDQGRFQRAIKEGRSIQEALDEQICPACQLFGCTGWSRRFRLEIGGIKGNDVDVGRGPRSGLKPNRTMWWSFHFISDLSPEQKWLFKKTLWIIENYGAIGGRTTWKPDGRWGTDYGLIEVEDYGGIERWDTFVNVGRVRGWLEENKRKLGRDNSKEWFNFRFYWIVEGQHLDREGMNRIVRRDLNNPQKYLDDPKKEFNKWLGGERGVTKKIFSFEAANKVFGYVRGEDEIAEIRERLEELLRSPLNFKTGEEILEGLK